MRVFQKVNMSRSHVADLQPLERSLAVKKRENLHHLGGKRTFDFFGKSWNRVCIETA